MNKLGKIALVSGFVIIAYITLLLIMPVLTDTIVTANATMAASSNMSDYPGTAGFFVSMPWILFFVPAVIGTAAVILILKQD